MVVGVSGSFVDRSLFHQALELLEEMKMKSCEANEFCSSAIANDLWEILRPTIIFLQVTSKTHEIWLIVSPKQFTWESLDFATLSPLMVSVEEENLVQGKAKISCMGFFFEFASMHLTIFSLPRLWRRTFCRSFCETTFLLHFWKIDFQIAFLWSVKVFLSLLAEEASFGVSLKGMGLSSLPVHRHRSYVKHPLCFPCATVVW